MNAAGVLDRFAVRVEDLQPAAPIFGSASKQAHNFAMQSGGNLGVVVMQDEECRRGGLHPDLFAAAEAEVAPVWMSRACGQSRRTSVGVESLDPLSTTMISKSTPSLPPATPGTPRQHPLPVERADEMTESLGVYFSGHCSRQDAKSAISI
jgi:hypothetical protein